LKGCDYRFPTEFVERYRQLGDIDALLEAMRRPLRRTARVNTLKATTAQVLALLADISPEVLPWYADGLILGDGAAVGRRLEHFLGLIYVQEAASMVPPLVLAPEPGDTVLDISAAPGSKTTQMAALMQNTGLIVANDSSPVRVRGLVGNIDRAGCLNVAVTRLDGIRLAQPLAGRCDRVLVDAPCSAEGTIRKSAQALEQWSLDAFARFATIQRGLLQAGYRCLKPGGRLVYSTCTLAPEENEGAVNWLLARESGAEVLDWDLSGLVTHPGVVEWQGERYDSTVARARRILPQDNDTEAFFVALIRKGEDAAG
jgi:NOL1/NOP2/sun family putative RNA methylase